jgi:hypothetical protein
MIDVRVDCAYMFVLVLRSLRICLVHFVLLIRYILCDIYDYELFDLIATVGAEI